MTDARIPRHSFLALVLSIAPLTGCSGADPDDDSGDGATTPNTGGAGLGTGGATPGAGGGDLGTGGGDLGTGGDFGTGGGTSPGVGGGDVMTGGTGPGTGGADLGTGGGIDGTGGSAGSGGSGSGGTTTVSEHYFDAGAWQGYGYSNAGPADGGTVSELTAGFVSGSASVCISGTLAEDYSSLGTVGMAVNQAMGSDVQEEWLPGDYEGVRVSVTRNVDTGLRLELLTADETGYCVELSGDEATLPWSRFRTECWGTDGDVYDPNTPIVRAQLYAPGDQNSVVNFDYCVDELEPVEDAGGGNIDPGKKFVGNITTGYQVRSDFIDYWDQITPENEGKWSSVEGNRDNYNWSSVDESYNYSREHGIPFKQHTFVWGNQSPSWINSLSASEQAAEIEEWIRDFCARYPDTELIDVVNESTPGHAPAEYARNAYGDDWIIDVFNIADEYCPNSILILNDYNVLTWNTDEFVAMATPAVNAGVVDAIGLQAHGWADWSLSDLQANFQKVLALGLPIYISEYDVDVQDDQQQLAVMQEQFPYFYEHPSVHGITLWGYIYGSTWVDHSGLIRQDGTHRPAMTWLMDYLGR